MNTGVNNVTDPATCKAVLASSCVPSPSRWKRFQGYAIPHGGFGMSNAGFTDWTAEFLLTRGPYAILGYTCVKPARARARKARRQRPAPLPPTHTHAPPPPRSGFGCTDGSTENPRAPEWDEEFGEPLGVCAETAPGSGVFAREWAGATVQFDCNAGHGSITRK